MGSESSKSSSSSSKSTTALTPTTSAPKRALPSAASNSVSIRNNSASSSSSSSSAALFISQQTRPEITPGLLVNKINCVFAVDRSGSMDSERRFSIAQAGVAQCISDLGLEDFVSLFTFNSEVELVAFGPKIAALPLLKKFNAMRPNGGTALYDAILQAAAIAIKLHCAVDGSTKMRVITYIVILTDGEDNESKNSLSDACEALSAISQLDMFKIILAGIGLNSTARNALTRLAASGENCQFCDLKKSEDIKDLFAHVSMVLRVREVQETVVLGVRTS